MVQSCRMKIVGRAVSSASKRFSQQSFSGHEARGTLEHSRDANGNGGCVLVVRIDEFLAEAAERIQLPAPIALPPMLLQLPDAGTDRGANLIPSILAREVRPVTASAA